MFHFGGFPSYTYVFSIWSCILHAGGFPIRKSADRNLFAAPRSLSQLVTSFVGSWCQGIPLMLFLAWTSSLNSLLHEFRFSLAWIAVYHVFYSYYFRFWQNCLTLPFYRKDLLFDFQKCLSCFLCTCSCTLNSLFGFQWSPRLLPLLTWFSPGYTKLPHSHAKALYNPILLKHGTSSA